MALPLSWTRLPFHYTTSADYRRRLLDYVGEAFYERLPAAGYEVREEQVYTAFRIAEALVGDEALLAEAELGTGKTLAYLIPAVCHARFRGRPVLIAAASPLLQTQLLSPNGDVAACNRILGLDIDARLAKVASEYVCEIKHTALRWHAPRRRGLTALRRWADQSDSGDRAEVPWADDELWSLLGWEPGLPCDTCSRRGRCHLPQAREHYRAAADLVICDHDLFFADLWSRRERREQQQRPLLPEHSAVIFDEGHRIADAAQESAAHSLAAPSLRATLLQCAAGNERPALLRSAGAALRAGRAFWAVVAAATVPADAERLPLRREPELGTAAATLHDAIAAVQDEVAIDEQMNAGLAEEARLLALQERLDAARACLQRLQTPPSESVLWLTPVGELWAAPRHPQALLQAELYRRKLPLVFTSATLAGGVSFDYSRRLLGLPEAAGSQAGSSFDLARQALVYCPPPDAGAAAAERLLALLAATDGRTLVLLHSRRQQAELRAALAGRDLPWRLFWEGDGDRTGLLRRFRRETRSVLLGTDFWEGVDVPGQSLSCVAVPALPWPADDPVLASRRADAAAAGLDPWDAINVPAMALRLKQGRGRLIRSRRDRGVFGLLDTTWVGTAWEAAVRAALPEGARTTESLGEVTAFLRRRGVTGRRQGRDGNGRG